MLNSTQVGQPGLISPLQVWTELAPEKRRQTLALLAQLAFNCLMTPKTQSNLVQRQVKEQKDANRTKPR